MTPAQEQQAIEYFGQQNPEFASSPPELQHAFIAALAAGSPNERLSKIAALQKQYPQYIKTESLWKNKAFLAGLAGLTLGVGSALVGGGAAAGAGGAAATAPTTLGAAGPLAADEVFTAGPIAGAGMAGVEGASTLGAAAGGGSLIHALLPSIIGAGASVGGAAIASHGQTEAAKLQAEQADKALALQKEMFDLQRSDLAPYRALGTGAVGNLAYLGGINLPPAEAAAPAPSTVVAPGAVDASGKPMAGAGQNQTVPPSPTMAQQQTNSLSTLGAPSGGLISMRNPQTGLVHLIPPDQVAAAQQAGGVRV